jgi:hypothetical protein
VFLEIPSIRAIALTGNPSARCNWRISAESSTDNTLPPPSSDEPGWQGEGQNSRTGLFSNADDTKRRSVCEVAFADAHQRP